MWCLLEIVVFAVQYIFKYIVYFCCFLLCVVCDYHHPFAELYSLWDVFNIEHKQLC